MVVRPTMSRQEMENQMKFKQLTLDFSRLCNSHCRLCKIWKIKNPQTLEIEYIDKLFSQIDELESLYITGGEPYINPIIFQIAESFLKHHPKAMWLGATNSIDLNTAKNIKKIRDMGVFVGQVDLSFEGPRHDYWRGTKGNRERVIETAKELRSYGILYAFAAVAGEGPDNVPELGDYIYRGKIRTGKRIETPDDGSRVFVRDCPGAVDNLGCDPDGNIWPCEDYQPGIFLGNIKTMDLKDMPFDRVRQYIKEGKCSPCTMNCWERKEE